MSLSTIGCHVVKLHGIAWETDVSWVEGDGVASETENSIMRKMMIAVAGAAKCIGKIMFLAWTRRNANGMGTI